MARTRRRAPEWWLHPTYHSRDYFQERYHLCPRTCTVPDGRNFRDMYGEVILSPRPRFGWREVRVPRKKAKRDELRRIVSKGRRRADQLVIKEQLLSDDNN